jgi:hypothetical protein
MKTPLKKRVKADATKQLNRYRGSGAWLNQAVPLNPSLRLNNSYKNKLDFIIELCATSRRMENYLNLEVLIANLLRKRALRPVRVSLNANDWKITRYNKAGESTIKLIHKLDDEGLIKLRKGYRTKKQSRQSRIWPTEKLLEYFPRLPNGVIYDPVEVVQLRDNKGRLKDYKETAQTRRIRAILTRANEVNNAANIVYCGYTLHPSLIAIFKRKFTLYGRLHTKGHRHYQGLSSRERKEILINGDSVVELDFSGLHPHLLYAMEGIQLNGDPYNITDQRSGVVRTFLKHILLCMLNAKDERKAEQAANYWLYKNYSKSLILKNCGIASASPLMTKFREAHKPIEHHFCNGKDTGLKIMNLDSRIALDIVDHFAEQKIPILAIHDSFIVQKKYKEELRQVMESTYEKHTKGFKCKIK